ncbi:MAG TPA: trypco2 family protein [Pseudonocardiaceae bacterium]|jgi:hypothetical protein|nr:trypco2 family protein [Pseudonocardiaceae bacterium]
MELTPTGVPVDSLIDAVKAAVRTAGISAADPDRTLRVASVQLVLNAVATRQAGAKLQFTIPFIGMEIKLGTSVKREDTHTVDITLVPPDLAPGHEVRAGDVDEVLVEAIETVTAVAEHAAGGDDPFVLRDSTVELTFAITDTGSISLGVDAEAENAVTHTLKITFAAP